MKPIAQTKSFSVCLFGYTLPKFSLYGNVYGRTWYATDFTPRRDDSGMNYYFIHVYCLNKKHPERRGSWRLTDTRDGFGAIYCRIRDFVKTADFINAPVVRCEHRNAKAQELAAAAERAERDHKRAQNRERAQFLRDAGAPQEKRACNELMYRIRPQGGNIDFEYTSCMDVSAYVGIDGIAMRNHTKYAQRFEQGQTTCGDASDECPYTRSGFEVKRDGLKTRFADYGKYYTDQHAKKVDKPLVAKSEEPTWHGSEHVVGDPVAKAMELFNTNKPNSAQIQYAKAWC